MELDADGEAMMAAARKAYEAYAGRAGWKSLVTGDPLPQWADLPGSVMNGWFAAATAVIGSFRAQPAALQRDHAASAARVEALAPHAKWLRQAGAEIARDGHAGWGNTCSYAADAIDTALTQSDAARPAGEMT
jgi:hypothetical protein